MDEQTLSALFPTGCEECLTYAVALYGQPLLRYCHHILCDYHEAQDAVQMTFIKAWERRTQFSGGSLKAWLFRLGYTASIDLMRRKKRWFTAPPTESTQGNSDYISGELRAALFTLSPEERALVFGRVMEGLSYDELSERHGTAAATLRKRYERARKKLAAALTHSGKECISYEAESRRSADPRRSLPNRHPEL